MALFCQVLRRILKIEKEAHLIRRLKTRLNTWNILVSRCSYRHVDFGVLIKNLMDHITRLCIIIVRFIIIIQKFSTFLQRPHLSHHHYRQRHPRHQTPSPPPPPPPPSKTPLSPPKTETRH
mmetsp:Transcript_11311/g.23779  ORF Transcript_11311/g.23779 Transcript_11311/m.23779 type:complete len:121 (-) Transcript_11311:348-710(-)